MLFCCYLINILKMNESSDNEKESQEVLLTSNRNDNYTFYPDKASEYYVKKTIKFLTKKIYLLRLKKKPNKPSAVRPIEDFIGKLNFIVYRNGLFISFYMGF